MGAGASVSREPTGFERPSNLYIIVAAKGVSNVESCDGELSTVPSVLGPSVLRPEDEVPEEPGPDGPVWRSTFLLPGDILTTAVRICPSLTSRAFFVGRLARWGVV
jgi:hypothetical protein